MDISAVSNYSSDIQSLLMNGIKDVSRGANGKNATNQTAEYAKKGEPMYMEDMDSDKDGVVTLDEFKGYCESKGISSKSMVKMTQMAAAYRTMKAETEAIDYISKLIPNVHPNLRQDNSETNHLKGSEGQYKISNDSNKIASYDEYMKYCEQNVKPHELKADAKTEKTEDGKFEVKNSGKAINAYTKDVDDKLVSTFEESV